MKRIVILLVAAVFSAVVVKAQKLEVKELKAELNDPAATQYPVKDYNGDNCALIIVGLAVDNAKFEGNIIKQERKANGEYWVYITDGSMDMQINTKDYLPEPVEFVKLGITAVESGRTYRMFVERPNLEMSFEEELGIAKGFYKNYPLHTESSYFQDARKAYDIVLGRLDCPDELVDSLRNESNKMARIYKLSLFREKCMTRIEDSKKKSTFEDLKTWRAILMACNQLDTLTSEYPEIKGFTPIYEETVKIRNQHPQSKTTVEKEVTIQRQVITGTIRSTDPDKVRTFGSMSVYATNLSEVTNSTRSMSTRIGSVRSDGTFRVVMPDDMNYLYVSGEVKRKTKTHYISQNMNSIEIIID